MAGADEFEVWVLGRLVVLGIRPDARPTCGGRLVGGNTRDIAVRRAAKMPPPGHRRGTRVAHQHGDAGDGPAQLPHLFGAEALVHPRNGTVKAITLTRHRRQRVMADINHAA